MRFLFAIVYKNGLFQILGFSPYQKKKKTWNVGCLSEILPRTSRLLRCTRLQAFYKSVIFNRHVDTPLWKSQWYFRHSWKYCFNSIYNTAKINYPLYLWINSFFINAEQVIKPTALERRGYRYLVRKHHRRIVIYIICWAPSLWTAKLILPSTCNCTQDGLISTYHKRLLCFNIHLPHSVDNVDTDN